MERKQIDELWQNKATQEIIEELESLSETQEDEYTMLKLAQAYLLNSDEKKAKKVCGRIKMLFPGGEFFEAENDMIYAIKNGTTDSYLQKYVFDENDADVGIIKDAQKQEDEIELAQIHMASKKQKKEVKIPESIKEYFVDIAGMKKVQEELDGFYRELRLQIDREVNELNGDILNTHFAVCGKRGSGKTILANVIAHLLADFGVRENEEPIYLNARDVLRAYEGKKENKADAVVSLFEDIQDATVVIENIEDLIFDGDCSASAMKDIFVSLEQVLISRKSEISVIFTGSSSAMDKMKQINPTIQDSMSFIEISPYSTLELVEIAEKEAEKKALRIHENSKKALIQKIDMECKSPDFMNAITINRYLREAIRRLAYRYNDLMDATEKDMIYLMPEDFEIELEDDESVEEILAELDALVGMQSVKEQVKKKIYSASTASMAKEAGASRKGGYGSLHMVFTGNPGTGKTTVARLIGKIYHSLGILPRGKQVVECTRSELVGQYQGHTAKRVQEKFQEAAGGVLFIDEAYAICRGDNDDFGHEAVDEIIAQMENNRDSIMVILAGYGKEMKEFLGKNPGFASRIPESNRIEFEDYTLEEMVEIFKRMVKGQNMILGQDTLPCIKNMLEVRSKTPNFGNARGVRNLFEEVRTALDERLCVMKAVGKVITKNQYDIITKEDIERVAGRSIEKEKSLEDLLEELDGLTGLAAAKQKVHEMVDQISYQTMFKDQGVGNDMGTLHLVFKGNAGTGKTTVARILGEIYNKLGVLKKNVFVEVGRNDLVGQYQGQTAPKVIKKIEEADGGILFIDEAYSLAANDNDDFGKEAIYTLVAELENRRNSLMVIVAGYSDKMDEFLNVNQGLASRLSHEVIFEDYSEEELLEIFIHMLRQQNLILEDDELEGVRRLIGETKKKVKDFGNARGVRNIVEDVIKRKNSRIMSMVREQKEMPSREVLATITREDIGTSDIEAEEETLDELLAELQAMTGLASVKEKVQEMVNRIRIEQFKELQGVPTGGGNGTLHLVFKGNAGTGKTTVARILGKIYTQLGVLTRNVFVEVSRNDLVGQYQGQTAPKVIKKMNEADGGILFIDEAYTLINGEHDDFGREAIHTLVAEMENRRDRLMVIVAGYSDKMDEFLDVNQGLASRLSHEVIFEDYSIEEMLEIFMYILEQNNLLLEENTLDAVKDLIVKKRDSVKDFGNARGVRNLVEDAEKKKDSRLVNTGKASFTKEELTTITKEDIEALQ